MEQLLNAAMAAPSANGVRPWHFVVVQEEAGRRALSQVHRWAHMCAQAPLVIAVCADADASRPFWIDDCSAAAENILLLANSMGLGGVWIGIHQSPEYQASVGEMLGLPRSVGVHCLLAIGHPNEQRPPYATYDAAKAHWERW